MKRLFLACAFTATIASLVISDLHAAPPKPKLPAKAVYIAIVSVDPVAMTITVAARNSMSTESKTYKVTPATVVKLNGSPATLADLKPDMAIHFELTGDESTTTELSASRAPAGS